MPTDSPARSTDKLPAFGSALACETIIVKGFSIVACPLVDKVKVGVILYVPGAAEVELIIIWQLGLLALNKQLLGLTVTVGAERSVS